MTIFNPSPSELSEAILKISRSRQPYIFVTTFPNKTGIIIKYQTSKRKNSTFKRFSLSHTQADTFATCCEALKVPVYYMRRDKDAN